jgi:uncharacterized protein
MNTIEKLRAEQKNAMRARDKVRLGTIRLALAAIKQDEVDMRKSLSEPEVISILTKMVKQRKDSIAQYEAAGRQDLADIEAREISVVQDFLPRPLSSDELKVIIENAISTASATSIRDMGKVMGLIKPQIEGRADMGLVGADIKKRLS